MKKSILTIILISFCVVSQAQETFLWPIAGAKTGENIISQPQDYIDKELNFAGLFIGAPLATAVLAPTNGTIKNIGATYYGNLNYSMQFHYNETFDKTIAEIGNSKHASNFDMKFVNGSIGLNIGTGMTMYINGLKGDKRFKTGQKINRGDTLGYVSYCYNRINAPSIQISISKFSIPSDPMTPFGLRTTFIAPTELKPVVSLTKAQAKEDFSMYIQTLRDIFPGLYNILTREELAQYEAETLATIDSYNEPIPFNRFMAIMNDAIAKIHDSHLAMTHVVGEKANSMLDYQPKIIFGVFNDSLVCTNATAEYKHLLNKTIKSINGKDAKAFKAKIISHTIEYDAKVESYKDFMVKNRGFGSFFRDAAKPTTFDMDIELLNGEKLDVKGVNVRKNGMPRYTNQENYVNFLTINRRKAGFTTEMLNDSTAYIGLTTFELNEVQVDEIGVFIDSISKADVKNLIVDVRNNNGGFVEPLEKLYSFVAGEPFTVHSYMRVSSPTFNSKLSLNYPVGDSVFGEYKAIEGREGFFDPATKDVTYVADSAINYRGKLYVLANENSVSAATLFPAMAVRNHRGVVVGRETRTAYHFMNAMKFANIRLLNSMITFRIPLVEAGFDTVVNARVPFGRGLLPDYPVELTWDEINYTNGDSILNYTLQLIEEGKYLSSENPFAAVDLKEDDASGNWFCDNFWWKVAGIVGLLTAVIIITRRKKKQIAD